MADGKLLKLLMVGGQAKAVLLSGKFDTAEGQMDRVEAFLETHDIPEGKSEKSVLLELAEGLQDARCKINELAQIKPALIKAIDDASPMVDELEETKRACPKSELLSCVYKSIHKAELQDLREARECILVLHDYCARLLADIDRIDSVTDELDKYVRWLSAEQAKPKSDMTDFAAMAREAMSNALRSLGQEVPDYNSDLDALPDKLFSAFSGTC